eukprot:4681138-Pyramimonas_sp.AAC.1
MSPDVSPDVSLDVVHEDASHLRLPICQPAPVSGADPHIVTRTIRLRPPSVLTVRVLTGLTEDRLDSPHHLHPGFHLPRPLPARSTSLGGARAAHPHKGPAVLRTPDFTPEFTPEFNPVGLELAPGRWCGTAVLTTPPASPPFA